MNTADSCTYLLWTGGWDSTFRLLELVVRDKKCVIPVYMIDEARPSFRAEILAMQKIKNAIAARWPETRGLIQGTMYKAVSDIKEDQTITAAFNNILKTSFMGSQYDWLARYCKDEGINAIELCIHRDDKAHAIIQRFVSQTSSGDSYVVSEAYRGSDEGTVFGCFSFPLLEFTKVSMKDVAEKNGWADIMGMTWFCHRPLFGNVPCGRCNPCRYTIEEGLGERIPPLSRLFGQILMFTGVKQIKKRVKALLGAK